MFASVNDFHATEVEIRIPQIGIWDADVKLSDVPSGTVFTDITLVLAGLVLVGRVYRGATWHGSYHARIVGGKGGWMTPLPAKGYRSLTSVKASLVLRDAAKAVNEHVEITSDDDWGLGSHWTRIAQPAGRVLNQLGRPWFMREDGVTVIRERETGTIGAQFDAISADPARGHYTIATESPEAFMPGKRVFGPTLDEMTIRAVVHRSAGSEVRTELWS